MFILPINPLAICALSAGPPIERWLLLKVDCLKDLLSTELKVSFSSASVITLSSNASR